MRNVLVLCVLLVCTAVPAATVQLTPWEKSFQSTVEAYKRTYDAKTAPFQRKVDAVKAIAFKALYLKVKTAFQDATKRGDAASALKYRLYLKDLEAKGPSAIQPVHLLSKSEGQAEIDAEYWHTVELADDERVAKSADAKREYDLRVDQASAVLLVKLQQELVAIVKAGRLDTAVRLRRRIRELEVRNVTEQDLLGEGSVSLVDQMLVEKPVTQGLSVQETYQIVSETYQLKQYDRSVLIWASHVGISTKASYQLDGKYTVFRTLVGASQRDPARLNLYFGVYGDGEELWYGTAADQNKTECLVSVKGVKVLQITVHGDGGWKNVAVWLSPRLK